MGEIIAADSEARMAERYEALIRVSQAIGAHREIKDVFRVMSTELKRVIGFDAMVVIHIVPDSDRMMWHFVETGGMPTDMAPAHSDNEISNWVFENQRPIVISCLKEETRFRNVTSRLIEFGIQSICMLPLTTVHRRVGCIGLACKHSHGFDKEDLRFLSLVADQTARAIDDAMNFEYLQSAQLGLEKSSRRLQLLLQLNNAVVSNLELRDLFLAVSANMRAAMQCDAVGLILPDLKTDELRGYAIDFPDSNGFSHEGKPIAPEMVEVFRTGIPHTLLSGPDKPFNPVLTDGGLTSVCYFPLTSRQRTLGVLALARKAAIAFGQNDLELLGQIGTQIGIAIENALAYREIGELKDQLAQQNVYLEGEIRSELNFEEIVGNSEVLARVLRQVETVAPTDSTVLIFGDTGTGKELIARALHKLSKRASKSFVKLNCAAIPSGLLESELFGHERGAFTGAVAQRIGRFELAKEGTVFLDEIGEIPLELQPKLLRVLQEHEFERLGSSRTLRADARLVAATNRDLAAMVGEQTFRADLFYRLSVFPIYVPPLRERREDIPLLVRHFVQHFARRMNRSITTIPSEAMAVLVRYHWPGNIRELQNLMERAVILSPGPLLSIPLQDLQTEPATNSGGKKIVTLEEAERQHILSALDASDWVISGSRGASTALGMKRSTLQARMEKLGIRRAKAAG